MHSQLSICIFADSEDLAQLLTQILSNHRYSLNILHSAQEFISFVEQKKEEIDCLIFVNDDHCLPLLNKLYEQGTLLPAIAIEDDLAMVAQEKLTAVEVGKPTYLYHSGEVRLSRKQIESISSCIDQAIAQFLHLGPSCDLSEHPAKIELDRHNNKEVFLILQQRRLAEKLKERLGYLGVYYARNTQQFYRNLSSEEKKVILEQLNVEYRLILLNYFSDDAEINSLIDQFIHRAFFCDMSVTQVLEIHMELMDEFAQQLKLEGRSEEILLDYRLTLIDIIAHLSEMYRRSIPR